MIKKILAEPISEKVSGH